MEACTPYGCSLVVLFGFLLGMAFSAGCVMWGMWSAHRERRADREPTTKGQVAEATALLQRQHEALSEILQAVRSRGLRNYE